MKNKAVASKAHHMLVDEDELGALNARIVRKMQGMKPAELLGYVVASGIYTPDGKLTKEYGGTGVARR